MALPPPLHRWKNANRQVWLLSSDLETKYARNNETRDEEYEELRIQSDESSTVMKRMNSTQPFKYVGITTTPDGDPTSSVNALKQICYAFRANLHRTDLTSEYYKKALHNIFVPRVRYQTAVYNISYMQYQTIQKIYEGTIISKLGYNKHWPCALRYGTHCMGSLQLPNFHLEQTIQQLQTVITMLHTPTLKGLITATFEMFQLQAGYGKDLLEYPRKVEYTDSTWYRSLMDAMVQYNISIKRPIPTEIKKCGKMTSLSWNYLPHSQ